MLSALLSDIPTPGRHNATSIAEYGILLINYASSQGFETGESITVGTRSQIIMHAREWISGIESAIEKMSASEAISLLESYDFVQRFILNREPDMKFLFRYVDKALEANIHGDRGVDIYQLYKQISYGLSCKEKKYFGKALDWNTLMLTKWHKEFHTGEYSGRLPISDYDVINRAAILLSENLYAFEPDQTTFKKRIFNNHRHYLDEIVDVYETWATDKALNLDLKTLESTSDLLRASRSLITDKDYAKYKNSILAAIYDNTTSAYLRATIKCIIAA